MKSITLLTAAMIGTATAQVDIVPDIDPASDPMTQPFEGTPIEGYRLVWSDEFNGEEILGNKWYYRTDAKLWSAQMPANNSVSDGFYRIAGRKQKAQGKDYTGGGMITKKLFKYGYYETRMKVPDGGGWHTSFWMMRDVGLADVPLDGTHIELDVIENDSSDPFHYQTDAHDWRPGPHRKIGTRQIRPDEPLTDFHVYGMEFTPEKLRYFFDGKVVSETDASVFKHNPVNIWLTCLAAKLGPKTDKVDEDKLPVEAAYDYVRFFQKEHAEVEITTPATTEVNHPDPNQPLELEARIINRSSPDLVTVVNWSRHWGPGLVDFENPKSLKTSVTFPRKGRFDLQCTIFVGSITKDAKITVHVGQE